MNILNADATDSQSINKSNEISILESNKTDVCNIIHSNQNLDEYSINKNNNNNDNINNDDINNDNINNDINNDDINNDDKNNDDINNNNINNDNINTETESNIMRDTMDMSEISTPAIFLNEIETWKGKQEKDLPRRGKYLRLCPDIDSIHDKPQLTSKIPLLQNGNMLGPQNIAGQYAIIVNTCAFDTIVQSLLVGYRDWISYHDYINNISNNELLDFVKLVSAHGTLQKIYKKRALILSNIFKPVSGRMNCAYNISSLLEKHLIQNASSFEISQRCLTCEWTNKENTAVIQINTKIIYEKGMRGLQETITQKVKDTNKTCKRCTNDVISTFATNAHLFIDMEVLQLTELAARLEYSDWSGAFTLSEIPVDIQCCDVTYKLVAAIEYIGSDNKNEIGHYVAHCRRIIGTWETYDDISKNKKSVKTSKRIQLQKKKYHY